MNKKTRGYQHGECLITGIESIPSEAKKKIDNSATFKLADSETTGNHHLLEMGPHVSLYEANGVVFMENSEPATVKCVMESRHDNIEIPAGSWQFGIAREYDYVTESVQRVAD